MPNDNQVPLDVFIPFPIPRSFSSVFSSYRLRRRRRPRRAREMQLLSVAEGLQADLSLFPNARCHNKH